MVESLNELLIAAGEAPPERRIQYRDPIAAYGAAAIVQMSKWAQDPSYVSFAIRVIGRAAERGAMAEGVAALRLIAINGITATSSGDATSELSRLKVNPSRPSPRSRSMRTKPPSAPAMDLSDLVIGREYKRADLHDRGLGGNRQVGISYPSGGDHVLLFSDPESRRDYGYKNTWNGDEYRYFGGWNGTMQMELAGGNRVIIDRSPNIHLFVKSPNGFRYEGRFAYSSHEYEWTERDGRAQQAIVFGLYRAPAS